MPFTGGAEDLVHLGDRAEPTRPIPAVESGPGLTKEETLTDYRTDRPSGVRAEEVSQLQQEAGLQLHAEQGSGGAGCGAAEVGSEWREDGFSLRR